MGRLHSSFIMSGEKQQQKREYTNQVAYDKSRKFNNLESSAYDHGLGRETWCTVEKSSNAAHTRKSRKHYHEANASTVFQTQRTNILDDSDSGQITIGQYPEKRHFPDRSNVSQQQRTYKAPEAESSD